MTSRVVRGGKGARFPGELTAIVISCDRMSCDTAVNDEDIRKHGGLREMGWATVPQNGQLRHYCPEHAPA